MLTLVIVERRRLTIQDSWVLHETLALSTHILVTPLAGLIAERMLERKENKPKKLRKEREVSVTQRAQTHEVSEYNQQILMP